MVLNDKDKEYIRYLVDEIDQAVKFNDKDFWKSTLRRIDNIPRVVKIKMLRDLVEHFDLEKAQET